MSVSRDDLNALFVAYLSAVEDTKRAAERVLTWTDTDSYDPSSLYTELAASMDATKAARKTLDESMDVAVADEVFS
jgi:hypothetical protein